MTQQTPPPATAKKGPSAKLIFSLLLLLLTVIFVLQNSQEVTITFFAWDVKAPLVLALAIMFITGALVVYLLLWQQINALRKETRQLRKQLEKQRAKP